MNRSEFVDEAEAYRLLAQAGLHPPRHGRAGSFLPFAAGEPVVLKGLGERLWHKSELGAVLFLPFASDAVSAAAARMRERVEAAGYRWIDGLVCERVAIARNDSLPSEAFLSLSWSEAGGIVLFGFGGLAADALAGLAPPLRWPLAFTTPDEALVEFEAHLLGRIWLGRVRGASPLTTREELSQFFQSVWALAVVAEQEGMELLEMNPVALDANGVPRPLDAVGCRRTPPEHRRAPPDDFLGALRAPQRIALAGVSAQPGGVGRTILDNVRRYPLPPGQLLLVKPGLDTFQGLPCIPDVRALLASPVDLLILALPAAAAFDTVAQLLDQQGGAQCVALVAGGLGDGADHDGLGAKLSARLQEARAAGRWTPTVIGPNFLGHWVPARNLDTSFIPTEKLAAPLMEPALRKGSLVHASEDRVPGPRSTRDLGPAGAGLTLLSQSGAFLLSRRSRQTELRFAFGLALGNQLDLALCDVLAALAAEDGSGPIAAYVEGFGPGQLLPAAHAIARLTAQGRQVLIHRAGRTEAGQVAAASHTGAMAGDLVRERSLLERAGAGFAETIAEFDAALAWLSAWPRPVGGPVALVTNAGFESVNGSDVLGASQPAAHPMAMCRLSGSAQDSLNAILAKHELAGLVTPRLPLDLTPMAGESAFLETVDLLLGESGVIVVGLVPFTRRLDTTPAGGAALAAQLLQLSGKHRKPVAVVVDAGTDYDGYVQCFRRAGLPVFDRMETALRGLHLVAASGG